MLYFTMADAERSSGVPDALRHWRLKSHAPGVVVALVSIVREPSLPRAISALVPPARAYTWQGSATLMPIEDHETTSGSPRSISLGWTTSEATDAGMGGGIPCGEGRKPETGREEGGCTEGGAAPCREKSPLKREKMLPNALTFANGLAPRLEELME